MAEKAHAATTTPLLEVRNLVVEFAQRRGFLDLLAGRGQRAVRAVDDVSLEIAPNETLGLVGESGSGKTTLGRAIMRLVEPRTGGIHLDGRDILAPAARRDISRDVQMVFQDPYSSLNPAFTVGAAIREVLVFHGICPRPHAEDEVVRLLELVGLRPDTARRYPGALSGGQRQRVGLARALAVRPRLLVLDEPVAALDVSIQAQILNLLNELKHELELTMLFIAHELSVVRHMSDRVAVMYLGRIVEIGGKDEIFHAPRHPYTLGLMRAAPKLVPKRRERSAVLAGDVPSPLDIPPGCRFHPRCPMAQEICRSVAPPEIAVSRRHTSACHFAEDADLFAEDGRRRAG